MRRITLLSAAMFLATSGTGIAFAQTTPPITFVHRAEAVMIILKNAGVPVDLTAKTFNAYPDVIDGEWYVPYMMKGLEKGMVEVEKKTGLMKPHASVTRGELLQMITKAFDLTSGISYAYTDVERNTWYAAYAGLAQKYALFDTTNNPNLLRPDLRVSHTETMQALTQLLTAEPQLRSKTGTAPLPLKTITQNAQTLEVVSLSLQRATKEVASYITSTTPQSVKAAMMKLLQNRTNLAESTRNSLIDAVNKERAIFRLAPLTANYSLEIAAQRHAQDMNDRGYFSHFTPEGLSYVERVRNAGYLKPSPGGCGCPSQFSIDTENSQSPGFSVAGGDTCTCEPQFALGENLAKGQLSVEQVVEDWMNSPNHRENILRSEFAEIGIGIFGDVWVQEFGSVRFH